MRAYGRSTAAIAVLRMSARVRESAHARLWCIRARLQRKPMHLSAPHLHCISERLPLEKALGSRR